MLTQPLMVFIPSYISANTWNKLTEDLRSLTSLNEFRTKQNMSYVELANYLMNELQQALSTLNHEKITQGLLSTNCNWIDFKMNRPHASHIGGVWERQIRTVRNVVASLLRHHGTQLDGESLRTFMIEAEAIVNCRPLTFDMINTAPTPHSRTPNHLLTMKSKVIMPPPGDFRRPDLYSRKRWRRVQYLANKFWTRWSQDYVQSQQPRQKWVRTRRNMQVGDIVIVY